MDSSSRPRLNYLVGASLAYSITVGVLFHLLATLLPIGWTPPLLVGFYLVFLLFWTLPLSALLGVVLGLLLRFAVRRLGPGAFSSWRHRLALAAAFGLLEGVGVALIGSRLWHTEVCLLAGLLGASSGIAFVLVVLPRRAGRSQGGADVLTRVRAMLEQIVVSAELPEGEALRDQIAQVTSVDGQTAMLSLTTSSTRRVAYPDGPLPVDVYVIEDGTPVGDVRVWIEDGFLARLEFAWWSDEAPAWPPATISIEARARRDR